jgi:predicted dehydrogenase
MLRVAIIGCGKIADQHVQAIQRTGKGEIVGVCDRELLMAQQLAERFRIPEYFSDFDDLINKVRPDVVHITTPPQSHYILGQECLRADCHVYLEKPFTVTSVEAESLLELAEERGLKITAGHNLLFTLEMLEMRRLVASGFLGGPPVHIESSFSYSLDDTTYVGPLLSSKSHWVRKLPGQLFQNLISHGISRIAEHLRGDLAVLSATAHQSPRLRSLGGQEILDELRVCLRDSEGTTASFCFSTQIKPPVNRLRLYGPMNTLSVDLVSGSVIRHLTRSSKSYLTYFIPPFRMAKEHFNNGWRNIRDFLGRRLYQDAGMKDLISRFYDSISASSSPPIPNREILLTARIMDEIFRQVYPQNQHRPEGQLPSARSVLAGAL